MQTIDHSFGKIRNLLWPIHSSEHKKFVPMFLLFFLISFVYNLLRNMKIALVVTLKGSGAHTIPFLKLGCVLPGALLLTFIFTKLINRYTREQVFYTVLTGFLTYFVIFMLFLFPYREMFELNQLADYLGANVFTAEGLSGMLAIIRYWNIALFYVIAELWSAVVLSMLFWGFTNEVTKACEAKRFYSGFALGANSSSIFIGIFVNWLAGLTLYHIDFYDMGYQWVFYQMGTVIVIGFVILALFYYLNRKILDISHVPSIELPKKKLKMSMRECFRYLLTSRYLQCIVVIITAYHMVYNLTDVIWVHKAKQVYQESHAYNIYMSDVTRLTGFVAAALAFFVSGNLIRKFGWHFGALVTPVMWLILGLCFFIGMLTESNMVGDGIFWGMVSNPANFVLLLGTMQICIGRGCKYTIFDATKEMTFIPLSHHEQRKGKAIVDGIASRFGKSCGSLIFIPLLLIAGDIGMTIPYVFAIFLLTIVFWIFAINKLHHMFAEKHIDVPTDLPEDEVEEAQATSRTASTNKPVIA